MPNYIRIVANSRNDAIKKVENSLGHKNITILREGNIINKKKKWFKTIEEKVYYLDCVEYKNSNKKVVASTTNSTKNYRDDFSAPTPTSAPTVTTNRNNEQGKGFSLDPLVEQQNNINALLKIINQNQKSNLQTNIVENDNLANLDKILDDSSVELFKNKNNQIYSFLINRDFSKNFAKKISNFFDLERLDDVNAYCRLAKHIASFFKSSGIVRVYKDKPNYVFLLGSTGVGKTTTLSKIASCFYADEEHHQKPSLIKFASLDAKRIMAMEQLRKFANILRMPFKSLYNLKDFKELCLNAKKKELVLIDTSGVSRKENELIDEIASFVNGLKSSKEVHLCLGAQSRYLDLKKTYESLVKINPDRIIITKVDESYSLGSVLSLIDEINLPISYITNGQDVPMDIMSSNNLKIQKILLEEWGL